MAAEDTTNFLAGVIEGFYGQPWSPAERVELFDWMARWGLNTYLYAPKDDLKHRALWREPYTAAEADAMGSLIQACVQRGLRFIYGLSPGLDIRYASGTDLDRLKGRCEQMLALGCSHFALLFDDIPDRLHPEDVQRWGSPAAAQCHVTNAMFRWVRERRPEARFLFCPTPYCSRMVRRRHGGEDYLPTIGRGLLPEIDVFWTGPEIISREITAAHARELQTALHRQPLIWDNLHANDYDGRRFYGGPYSGRPPELRGAVSGLLSNPNCEFELNFVPLRTLAAFVRGSESWNPRQAYLAAMREWLPRFATVGQPIALEDLVRLGDCFYLPHEEGPEAEALYQALRGLLSGDGIDRDARLDGFRRPSKRLRETCARLTELRHRPLFHALSRRLWDLREELELLEQYLDAGNAGGRSGDPSLTFHLPGTYRGGLVAKLQRLLVQHPDGTYSAAAGEEGAPSADPSVASVVSAS